MPYITVDDEQARMISETPENVEIRNRQGQRVGYATHGLGKEDWEDFVIARQRRAANKPGYTIDQVMEHLKTLEQSLERK